MPDELPPVLLGLTALEIHKHILEKNDASLAALATGLIEHPEDADEPS